MTLNATKLVPLATLLALLLTASPAAAQIEVYDNGHVLVGEAVGHSGETALMVKNHDGADPNRYGLRAQAVGGTYNYGLMGEGIRGEVARGLWGRAAQGASGNTGVFADADGSPRAVGLYARGAYGTTDNYGVWAVAGGHGGSSIKYGIHAETWGDGTRYAGRFDGDVYVAGEITQTSDGEFKEDIEGLSGAGVLAKVKRLKPKRYRYKQDRRGKRMGLSERERFGFLAEEVEGVFPELVREQTHVVSAGAPGGEGAAPELAEMEAVTYKALNYTDLIPLLVQALQEQQGEIEALRTELDGLKKAK